MLARRFGIQELRGLDPAGEPKTEQAMNGENQTRPASKPQTGDGPRVLLVEDSPTVRMLATTMLSEAGFRVDAEADGHRALARALASSYDLLITGIETPGLRGLDLAAALRGSSSCRDLPIIILSSDENPEFRRRAGEIGVHAYIPRGSFGQRLLVQTALGLLAQSESRHPAH